MSADSVIVAYSPTGAGGTWAAGETPFDHIPNFEVGLDSPLGVVAAAVEYDGLWFVGVSRTPGAVLSADSLLVIRSMNGTHWAGVKTPVDPLVFSGSFEGFQTRQWSGIGVAYSPSLNRWVAMVQVQLGNHFAVEIMYSDDHGLTWTRSGTNPLTPVYPSDSSNGLVNAVCWSGSYFVAGGSGGAFPSDSIIISADGITWSLVDSPLSSTSGFPSQVLGEVRGLASDGAGTVLGWGSTTGTFTGGFQVYLIKSTDGGATWSTSWTDPATPGQDTPAPNGLHYSGGYYYACGFSASATSGLILGTPDGVTVTRLQTPLGQNGPHSYPWTFSAFYDVGSSTLLVSGVQEVAFEDVSTVVARGAGPLPGGSIPLVSDPLLNINPTETTGPPSGLDITRGSGIWVLLLNRPGTFVLPSGAPWHVGHVVW